MLFVIWLNTPLPADLVGWKLTPLAQIPHRPGGNALSFCNLLGGQLFRAHDFVRLIS